MAEKRIPHTQYNKLAMCAIRFDFLNVTREYRRIENLHPFPQRCLDEQYERSSIFNGICRLRRHQRLVESRSKGQLQQQGQGRIGHTLLYTATIFPNCRQVVSIQPAQAHPAGTNDRRH